MQGVFYITQELIDRAAVLGLKYYRCEFTVQGRGRFCWTRFGKNADAVSGGMIPILDTEFPTYTDLVVTAVTEADKNHQLLTRTKRPTPAP